VVKPYPHHAPRAPFLELMIFEGKMNKSLFGKTRRFLVIICLLVDRWFCYIFNVCLWWFIFPSARFDLWADGFNYTTGGQRWGRKYPFVGQPFFHKHKMLKGLQFVCCADRKKIINFRLTLLMVRPIQFVMII
jgi:hypothetical protein